MEIDNREYEILKRNADDNQSIVRFAKFLVSALLILVVFVVFMVSYGCNALDIRRRIDTANAEIEIREMQSEGMDFDDYIRWLEVKNEHS